MPITSLRSRLALVAVAAAAAGASLPAVASADQPAIPATKVDNWTVTEGQTATLRVKLTCERGFGPCTYAVDAIPLTAQRPSDFSGRTSPTRKKLIVRRAGHSMIAQVTFTATDDAQCEGTETARVRVIKRGRHGGSRRDYGTVTIRDNDCDTPTTPRPAPAPPAPPAPGPAPAAPTTPAAFPPDSGAPTVTTTALSDGTLGECTTPEWIGTDGTAGANGAFNSGCAVKVSCPPDARICSARAESRHTLEHAFDGERVSLNSRITVFSAGDTAYWHRDQSSAGAGFTRNEDPGVMIRGGESARIECNGVRITPTVQNRSQIGCSLTVERQP